MARNVGIYIYDEVEVLDFCGPFEVFCTASRIKPRRFPSSARPFEVFTIADSMRLVKARGGLMVHPSATITDHPKLDVLIVPGGVHNTEMNREDIIAWIAKTAAKTELTASVCTGAFLLAKAGLLNGKTVTTHWEDIDDFRGLFPDISIERERRWVEAGNIVTSAGISAGLDMSLHLVERLESEELAMKTARQMDYDWQRR